jgi:hypothetical protein
MDVGAVVIHVAGGVARVVRTIPAATGGMEFEAAVNQDALGDAVQSAVHSLAIDLRRDGLYPCPLDLAAASDFVPLALPSDLITPAEARTMLFPDLNENAGWARLHRAMQSGKLRGYRVGSGVDARRFVSRAEVRAYATQNATIRSGSTSRST